MKPRNKIEREVVRLSKSLPPINDRQKKWAVDNCISLDRAHRFRGKMYDVSHFIIATTKDGWQVLRHFYLYAHYRYKKLADTEFHEVMEQWFKDGEYVFMSKNRHMGYYMDGWCLGQPMSIKREITSYYLGDPRNLGYDRVYYARLAKRFSYIEKDDKSPHSIGDMFRAINTHPFNETLYKSFYEAWKWSIDNKFIFDREKTTAIKIAMRHRYDFMHPMWKDLIEMLIFLKKDLHNPKFVCPDNLQSMHDEISKLAMAKRKKQMKNAEYLAMVREERQRLERIRRQEEQEREKAELDENIKKEKDGVMSFYQKMRCKFFGVVIAENDLEIKVLQSINEFMEEGLEMHHCVFANAYYDVRKKPNSLIMSAKVNGERVETIEINMEDWTVVQCQGKYNQNTEWHDTILRLLNENMNKIKEIA